MSLKEKLALLDTMEQLVMHNINECAAIKIELTRIETELLIKSKLT